MKAVKTFFDFGNSLLKFCALFIGAVTLIFLCTIKVIINLVKRNKDNNSNYTKSNYPSNDINPVALKKENRVIGSKESETGSLNIGQFDNDKRNYVNLEINQNYNKSLNIIRNTFENYGLKILKYNIDNASSNIIIFLCCNVDEKKTSEYIKFIINFYDDDNKIIYSEAEEYSKEDITKTGIEIMINKKNIIRPVKKIKFYVAKGE